MSGQDDKCFFTVRSYTSDYSTDLAYGFDLDEKQDNNFTKIPFIYLQGKISYLCSVLDCHPSGNTEALASNYDNWGSSITIKVNGKTTTMPYDFFYRVKDNPFGLPALEGERVELSLISPAPDGFLDPTTLQPI